MRTPSLLVPRVRRRVTREPAPGSPPGTFVETKGLPKPVVHRTEFDAREHRVDAVEPEAVAEAVATVEGKTVWIDVQGLGDGSVVRAVGEALGLHALTMEDIVHVHHRPKVEEFDDYLLVIMRAVRLLDDGHVDNEQISVVLKEGLLVTFQERAGDGFEPVRRRLEEGRSQVRRHGADFLAYALIDATIDCYYPVVDAYGTTMDELDDAVRAQPKPELSRAIHNLRRELRQLRRAIWPLLDVTSALSRDEIAAVGEPARLSLRDCHDHVVQVVDFLDGARERASELADLFQIMVGERTNQVMKVLTIIATVFIPLTFLCGLYGMNFDPNSSPFNMPELRFRYGYPAFWGVTIVVVVGMLAAFRRRGWIGGASSVRRERDQGSGPGSQTP